MTKSQRNQSTQIRSRTKPQPKPVAPQSYDLAGKYRPQTFDDVIGQAQAVHELNAVFKTGHLPPPLLFVGQPGVGKTSLATIVAACINCESGPTATPCGNCTQCQSVRAGQWPAIISLEGPGISAHDAKKFIMDASFRPMGTRSKVFIIEDIDMLPKTVDTCLLQLFEKPPKHVQFVFTTTIAKNVERAVKSRTWEYKLSPVAKADLVRQLNRVAKLEGFELHPSAANRIAKDSFGSVRDAMQQLGRHLISEMAAGGAK